MAKKVALYARVSTERQAQAGTIESQVAELESYVQEQGYELDAELIFLDQGVSGGYLARPALDRLRDVAYEGGIDILLCLSPDRLARQYVHQCLLLEEFQRWGVAVQFIQQPDLADTPQNQLLLGVQGLFAEYERAVMRERMRRGRLYRLRQGERCFHSAPFGYRYIPVSEPNGGKWEIDTQEAGVVQQIFAWYTEECWSLKKIATQLNETGVPVRRKGGRWNAGRISVILDQPAYAGKAYYNRYRTRPESVGRRKKQGRGRLVAPDKVLRPRAEWIAMDTPAILSQEVWQRAQDQRMHNKRFSQRNNHKQFYLLRGLLVCGVCDGLMIGKSRHKHPYTYYRCERGGKHRLPDVPQHTCTVNAADAEKAVWEAVAALLQEPQRLAQAWADLHTTEPPNQREIKRLEHRSRQLERQWQRLLDAYQDGLLEKDELSQRKQALEREQTQLQSLLAQAQEIQLQNQTRLQTVQDFADFSQRMLETLDNPSEEVKREVIRLLADHIIVEDDAIIIHHIVPISKNERLSLKRKRSQKLLDICSAKWQVVQYNSVGNSHRKETCQMIRQPEREQLKRLTVKTLDQVFVMRAKEGLGCSLFEAQALTDLVKEVYFPWLSQPGAIQSGQLALTAVSADEPGYKPLSKCKMVPVLLTLYTGEEDHNYRLAQGQKKGIAALRRRQIMRMAQEALDQGALLTAEDFAFRIFNCGLRTISRDLQKLAEQDIIVPLRSQQKDAGRALTHRVQAVELYLKRYTFTQIQQRIHHSLTSIANYITTFTIVVAHTRSGYSVDEIAFLMQISPSLVSAYQELYREYNTPEYQERINEILTVVKARGFQPNDLTDSSTLSEVKKGGMQP